MGAFHETGMGNPDCGHHGDVRRGRELHAAWWFCVSAVLLALGVVGGQRLGVVASLAMVGASLVICHPIGLWFRNGMRSVPLFELICLYLFVAYCPQAFVGPLVFRGHAAYHEFSSAEIGLLGGVLCVAFSAVVLGHRTAGRVHLSLPRFDVRIERHAWYLIALLAASVLAPLFVGRVPIQLRKAFDIATLANAAACIFSLARVHGRRLLQPEQKLLFLLLLGIHIVLGISSGWLHSVIYTVLFFEMGLFLERKRISWPRVACAIVLVLCLNSSKGGFRSRYWTGTMAAEHVGAAGAVSRALDWVGMSLSGLGHLGESAETTVAGRLSNAEFLAYVVVTTPSRYPYTGLAPYVRIPAMLIPRFLWRGKPSTMDLPNEIALRYGYMGAHQVGRVALDIGLITEAYMAFGVVGVAAVMFAFGWFIGVLVNTLSASSRGSGWELVMVAIMRNGALMVTWTAASYFAGMWQTAALTALVYLPVASTRKGR